MFLALALKTMLLVTAKADSLTAWQEFYDALGGSLWNTCSNSRELPCSCSFVTCDSNSIITEIEIASAIYTGGTRLLSPELLQEFPSLRKFRITNAGNAWESIGTSCFKFQDTNVDNTDDSTTCDWQGNFGFCCYQQYQLDFFDSFSGDSWSSCSGLRNNLCSCNPSDPGKEVVCVNGVVTSLKLKDMNLLIVSNIAASRAINNIIRSGATFINLRENVGVNTQSGCANIGECATVDCRIPDDFFTCGPTTSPTNQPSTNPTTSPSPLPTVSPTIFPTYAPTESIPTTFPTLTPVDCNSFNDLPQNELQAECTLGNGCIYINRCENLTTVTCSHIDALGRKQRKRHCEHIFGCRLKGNNRCIEITHEPTASPISPTNYPSPAPTDTITCTDINNLKRRKKQKCETQEECLYIQRRCIDKPTTCVEIDDLPKRIKKNMCGEFSGCLQIEHSCIEKPANCSYINTLDNSGMICKEISTCAIQQNECVDIPESIPCEQIKEYFPESLQSECTARGCVFSRKSCISPPQNCVEANLLESNLRKSFCVSLPECQLVQGFCIAPEMLYSDCEIAVEGLGKRATQALCESKESIGCQFVPQTRKNVAGCFNITLDGEHKSCNKVDLLPLRRIKRELCTGECKFDLGGSNKDSGKCFELESCAAINNYGKSRKRKKVCLEPKLNGDLTCAFDKQLNQCMEIDMFNP